MQLLPSTAQFLAKRTNGYKFKVSDLSKPDVNIAYGSYYLRFLLDQYNGNVVEALAAYVYSETHRQVLRRRRSWFEQMTEAHLALWWVPRGHLPTTQEAEERVLRVRESGPTPYAFTLREHFPPPDVSASGPLFSPDDWTCPV